MINDLLNNDVGIGFSKTFYSLPSTLSLSRRRIFGIFGLGVLIAAATGRRRHDLILLRRLHARHTHAARLPDRVARLAKRGHVVRFVRLLHGAYAAAASASETAAAAAAASKASASAFASKWDVVGTN